MPINRKMYKKYVVLYIQWNITQPFEKKQIYDITNVESKKMVQMFLFIRWNQTHRQRKQT